MKRHFLVALIAVSSLVACKKENNETKPATLPIRVPPKF
jgi:hypothetical protein